jgi:hypothetical protein
MSNTLGPVPLRPDFGLSPQIMHRLVKISGPTALPGVVSLELG